MLSVETLLAEVLLDTVDSPVPAEVLEVKARELTDDVPTEPDSAGEVVEIEVALLPATLELDEEVLMEGTLLGTVDAVVPCEELSAGVKLLADDVSTDPVSSVEMLEV